MSIPDGITPIFLNLLKEAKLSAGLIAAGLTDSGKLAYFGQQHYYKMMFSLSIGIERLCKLIIISDSIINGDILGEVALKRKYGHKLERLIKEAVNISKKYPDAKNINLDCMEGEIEKAILSELENFGTKSRYHNISGFCDNDLTNEPISSWYRNVSRKILDIYMIRYYKKDKKVYIPECQFIIMPTEDDFIYSPHYDEHEASVKLAVKNLEIPVLQKYTKLYIMRAIRPLIEILLCIEDVAQIEGKLDIPYFSEIFCYVNFDDYMIKRRKKFGIV